MKDIIKLNSHDGSNNCLIKLNIPQYKNYQAYLLKTQYDYTRYIYDKEGINVISIDPSGGPMLNVGSVIDNTEYILEEINSIKYVGTILTLKKIENDSKRK